MEQPNIFEFVMKKNSRKRIFVTISFKPYRELLSFHHIIKSNMIHHQRSTENTKKSSGNVGLHVCQDFLDIAKLNRPRKAGAKLLIVPNFICFNRITDFAKQMDFICAY